MQGTDVTLVLFNQSLICLLALNLNSAQHLFKGYNDVKVSNYWQAKTRAAAAAAAAAAAKHTGEVLHALKLGKIDSRKQGARRSDLSREHGLFSEAAAAQQHHVTGGFAWQ